MARRLVAIGCAVAVILAVAQLLALPAHSTTPQTPAAQAEPRTGAVTGVVVDGSTGSLLSDVVVTIIASNGAPLPDDYQSRQMTDAKGRFAFLNLPDNGNFQINAAKYGYLDGGYGRDAGPTDALRSINFTTVTWVSNLRVPIWRGAVISGVVRDEAGGPVVGVYVRTLARIRIAGRDDLAAGPTTITDDYGRYRFSGLLPGRYLVQVPSVQATAPPGTRFNTATGNSAEGAIDVDDGTRLAIGRYPLPPPSANGRATAYPPAFHPDAVGPAQATAVDVKFGDDRVNVDVVLTPMAAFRVSGVVEAPPEALTQLTVRLIPAGMENLGSGAEVATALVGPGGRFTFVNVAAGAYTLDAPRTFNEFSIPSGATSSGGFVGQSGTALPAPPGGSSWSRSNQEIAAGGGVRFSSSDFRGAVNRNIPPHTGRQAITVGTSDLLDVKLRLRPGAVLRGKLVVEADPAQPAETGRSFQIFMDSSAAQPYLGRPSTAVQNGSGTDFEVVGIQPGEYFLRAQGGARWLLKSIQWRGRDYTTMPFDASVTDDLSGVIVTVTNLVPTIAGQVQGPNGSAARAGVTIAFPVQPGLRTNTGLWPTRLTSTAIAENGTYRFTTLPAGDYFVAAIDRAHAANWRDPTFLTLVEAQAARVTLSWGQTLSQDLTMAVIR